MRKAIILFVLLIQFPHLSSAQQPVLDSLWGIWKNESQADTARLKAMHKIAWQGYISTQPDSALYFAQMEYDLAKNSGLKKQMASALNTLGVASYIQRNYTAAIEYHTRSLNIRKEIGNKKRIAVSLNNLGNVYVSKGDHARAISSYSKCLQMREQNGDKRGMSASLINIGLIYFEQGDLDKALEYYTRSLDIMQSSGEMDYAPIALQNIGNIYHDRNDSERAMDNYLQALSIQEDQNDSFGIASLVSNLGVVYGELGDTSKAMESLSRGLSIFTEVDDSEGIAFCLYSLGGLYKGLGEHTKAISYCERALQVAKEVGAKTEIMNSAEVLYGIYSSLGRSRKALDNYELYISTRDSINSEENQREVLRQEYKYNYDKQALSDSLEFAQKQAIKDLEIEKQEANISRQRIALISTAGGLLLIVLLAFSIHKGKKRSDELLLNILPKETAKELKQKGQADAQLIDQVTVLFTDFKGFTAMSEQLSPKELVKDLHECFSAFDLICEKYGIEKIKTIGDAYMAAGGLPVPNTTHPQDVVNAALEMAEVVKEGKAKKITNEQLFFEVRIGIHTGPVVAGIVGIKKFAYDIWGDTVNTASRMESSGEVGKVNISESTYQLVKEQFTHEYRGEIEAKGKGKIKMYFVNEKT